MATTRWQWTVSTRCIPSLTLPSFHKHGLWPSNVHFAGITTHSLWLKLCWIGCLATAASCCARETIAELARLTVVSHLAEAGPPQDHSTRWQKA